MLTVLLSTFVAPLLLPFALLFGHADLNWDVILLFFTNLPEYLTRYGF